MGVIDMPEPKPIGNLICYQKERTMNDDLFVRVLDFLSSFEILDLQFILTDLVDIPISEAERGETGYYDAMALATCQGCDFDTSIPLGKLVL